MSFRDILLTLTPYPESTSLTAVDDSLALAAALDSRISAVACAVKHRVTRSILGNAPINLSAIVAEEDSKNAANAHSLLEKFQELATKRSVFQERILEKCPSSQAPAVFVDHARLQDLTNVTSTWMRTGPPSRSSSEPAIRR